jgi:hypothetical protein
VTFSKDAAAGSLEPISAAGVLAPQFNDGLIGHSDSVDQCPTSLLPVGFANVFTAVAEPAQRMLVQLERGR